MFRYAIGAIFVCTAGWLGFLGLKEIQSRNLSFDVSFSDTGSGLTDWNFVVLADLHNSEAYLQNKDERRMTTQTDRAALIEQHTDTYAMFAQAFETDIMMLPGDLADGEWFTPDLETRFRQELGYKDRVTAAADIVYSSFLKAAEDAGFNRIIVATGDHEYGDDPWAPLSRRDKSIPTFQALFAQYFGEKAHAAVDIESNFSTPVGTAFEGSSHAVKINNAVFVTVDMFKHTPHLPGQMFNFINGQIQTVTGTVEGAHLRWLEEVLKAARADSSTDLIFVQGHLPVLFPVRGRRTSIMYFDDAEDSAFWRLLQEYEVDAYFSGEVHSDTLIEDAQTDLIQITTRAGVPRSMLTGVRVNGADFEVLQYSKADDGTLVETGRYQTASETDGVVSSGVLTPLDRNQPVLAYSFDSLDNGIIANEGEFGTYFNLDCPDCELRTQDGRRFLANGLGNILDGYPSPVFLRSKPTTVSFWFRSQSPERSMIFTASDLGARKGFALILSNGQLVLKHSHKEAVVMTEDNLADEAWHHITIRHGIDELLEEADITVNGQNHQLMSIPSTQDTSFRDHVLMWQRGLDSPPNHSLSIGGHFSNGVESGVGVDFDFQGDIDDFKVWGRELSDTEIANLYAQQ